MLFWDDALPRRAFCTLKVREVLLTLLMDTYIPLSVGRFLAAICCAHVETVCFCIVRNIKRIASDVNHNKSICVVTELPGRK